MGFGSQLLQAVSIFYSCTLVTVLVNGRASEYFELGSGVRQDDPLSPDLCVILIDPMLNYLRETTGGFGISVPTDPLRHLLLAFADDCTGLLDDLADALLFVSTVQHYAEAAGLLLMCLRQ